MSNYNTSNYLRRKAERLALTPPQWVQNPETQEWFYLRVVGPMMATIISGVMPAALTSYAVGQWQDAGMEINSEQGNDSAKATDRDVIMMGKIVSRSCVIPILIPQGHERPTVYDPEHLKVITDALSQKYEDFNATNFDPQSIMLDAEDLDDSDITFIIEWATGQVGKVGLAGGQAMNVADLKSVPKKLNRGSRTSSNKQELRETA
jgi:hypothetical protein